MTDDELQYLVDHYRPSDQTLSALAGANLLAVVGPSASGKTTIIQKAIQTSPLLQKVKSVTDRAKRLGETDEEYDFLTRDQFQQAMQKQLFIQVALMPTGYFYGTWPEGYPKDKIGIMAPQAQVIPTFRKLFRDLKVVFIVPKSYETWMAWFNNQRSASEDDQTKRLQEAKTSLEFALNDQNIHFILNDEVDKAVARLIQVAEGAKPEGEDQARQIAEENYRKLIEIGMRAQ